MLHADGGETLSGLGQCKKVVIGCLSVHVNNKGQTCAKSQGHLTKKCPYKQASVGLFEEPSALTQKSMLQIFLCWSAL